MDEQCLMHQRGVECCDGIGGVCHPMIVGGHVDGCIFNIIDVCRGSRVEGREFGGEGDAVVRSECCGDISVFVVFHFLGGKAHVQELVEGVISDGVQHGATA